MRYWDSGHMDNDWGIVMVLGMLGIWALATIATVWLIRSYGPPTTRGAVPATLLPQGDAARAEQILGERMARGEIDVEEYKTRREALRSPVT